MAPRWPALGAQVPQHLEQFGPLLSTFPDATFVVPHRDPVAVTVSMTTMVTYSSRLSHRACRSAGPGPVLVERAARISSERVPPIVTFCPPEQSIDVQFDDFMAHDLETVERIYSAADQPFTSASRRAMEGFVADHPRGRNGTITYQPEVLGIDRFERAEALAFYFDRFGVKVRRPPAEVGQAGAGEALAEVLLQDLAHRVSWRIFGHELETLGDLLAGQLVGTGATNIR